MKSLFRAVELGLPIPPIPLEHLIRARNRAKVLLGQAKFRYEEIRKDLLNLISDQPENSETIEMVRKEKREASLLIEERISRMMILEWALKIQEKLDGNQDRNGNPEVLGGEGDSEVPGNPNQGTD